MAIHPDRPLPARLLSIGALLVLVVLVGVASNGQPARAQSYDSAIAQRALQDLGTYQGDCWPWVKRVVQDATGKTMGFGYISGYIQGGAVQVSMEEARAGDVIQISDPSNPDPGAYYNGLHTALILENLGGGVFNAIDSNQNWDGMVNLRPNYKPFARAASLGLAVHIWRFEGSAGSPGVSIAAPAEPDRPAGSQPARVATGTGECLRLRSGASAGSQILTCLADRSRVWITGEGVAADGYTWVPVTTLAGSGWMAIEFLELDPPTDATGAGSTDPEPTSTPEPTAEPTSTPEPEPTPTITRTDKHIYRIGVANVASDVSPAP